MRNEDQCARHLRLGDQGLLLVSADLHGNGEDFRRLEAIFLHYRDQDPQAQWLILGDLVHGPDIQSAHDAPELYGYRDESVWIIQRLQELQSAYPKSVHLVLGNHDYAHIGGEHTRKFHDDEVLHLESQMDPESVRAMHTLFEHAYLAASTQSGLLLTHGSPNLSLTSLAHLDHIDLTHRERSAWEREVLHGLLWAYGQSHETTDHMLRACSRHLPAHQPLRWVIHGHDRDEEGWFIEGDNQLCIVIFGAIRAHKRYLLLDLSRTYSTLDDLTHPDIMRLLYPPHSVTPDAL